MTLLTRYLLSEQIKIFILCLTALLSIYMSIDLFEKFRLFVSLKAAFSDAFLYFLFRLPEIIFEMTPLAILLSTFISMGLMSRRNEITAFLASGISITRIITPVIIFGFSVSVLLFVLNLSVISSMNKKAEYIKKVQIEKKNPDSFFKQGRFWFKNGKRTIYNIQMIDTTQNRFLGVTVYQLEEDFQLQEEKLAKELVYQDKRWILLNGIQRKFYDNGRIEFLPFKEKPISLNKTPDDFKRSKPLYREMSYSDLAHYVSRLKEEGYTPSKYLVDLHRKVAFPFSSFIMVVLAIPFSLRKEIKTHFTTGLGVSLFIGMSYWIIFQIFLSLGYSGILPPWLAAWLSNILFLIIGASLFTTIQR